MKKLILFAFLAATFSMNAQIGATAPDFTVTDIEGNEHNLYDILDQGIIAVVDVSATWCGPCWNLHQSHALEELHALHGPSGTNTIAVMYYEGDASTGMDALNGTGGSTLGDWVTGTTYPIVNEEPLQLDLSIWAPLGFPTVNVINPSDKVIVADTWNILDVQGQIDAIQEATGIALSVETVDQTVDAIDFKIFPVPAASTLNVDLSAINSTVDQVVVMDAFGRQVKSVAVNAAGIIAVAVEELAAGMYTLQLQNNGSAIASKQFVK